MASAGTPTSTLEATLVGNEPLKRGCWYSVHPRSEGESPHFTQLPRRYSNERCREVYAFGK